MHGGSPVPTVTATYGSAYDIDDKGKAKPQPPARGVALAAKIARNRTLYKGFAALGEARGLAVHGDVSQAADMNEKKPDIKGNGINRKTEFGEPLWLDVLKSAGVALTYLTVVILLGGALAIAIIAPWGRASFDCSIYCVLEQYVTSWFEP